MTVPTGTYETLPCSSSTGQPREPTGTTLGFGKGARGERSAGESQSRETDQRAALETVELQMHVGQYSTSGLNSA